MEQSESKTIISAQSKTNKAVSEAEEKKIVAQMIKMSRESLSEHIEGIRKPQAAIKAANNVK